MNKIKTHNYERECGAELNKVIHELMTNGFYGTIEINFENGVPIRAKEIKSIKFGLTNIK